MSMEERPRYPKSGKPIRSQPSTGHNNLPRCYESTRAPISWRYLTIMAIMAAEPPVVFPVLEKPHG